MRHRGRCDAAAGGERLATGDGASTLNAGRGKPGRFLVDAGAKWLESR